MTTSCGDRAAALRAFNRFYTNVIGVLGEGLLRTSHTLTEARVIYELGQVAAADVADLRRALDLDRGYLSRILGRFEDAGLVARSRSDSDRRRQVIRLTDRGRAAYDTLDRRSADDAEALLAALDEGGQRRLIAAMTTIAGLLGDARRTRTVVVRGLHPGDLGWVIQRHGELYAREYGWDETFEALVARIAADFGERHDPARERGWIAEVDGVPGACVLCVRRDDRTARRLRPHHALDPGLPRARPPDLRGGRVHPRGAGPPPELRPRPRRAVLVEAAPGGGAGARCTRAKTRAVVPQMSASRA